jgi:hypothetical protein
LAFGGRAKGIYPEGWFLMTIPYQALPNLIYGLKEMKWVPLACTEGKGKVPGARGKAVCGIDGKVPEPLRNLAG